MMRKIFPTLSIFLFITTLVVWSAVFIETPKNYIKVSFLDVGQGDAVFISSPWGNQILIDGGPNKKVLRELGKVMPWYDRSIDVVVSTHPDADHIGGLVDVLERYKVGAFIEPGVHSDTSVFKELLRIKDEKNIPTFLARKNMVVSLGDGAYMEILFPDRDVSDFETNTASVIARVVYGEQVFILTGDSPQSIEKYLTSLYGDKLKADVLKAGHHGSKTSSAEIFLSSVSPSVVVISAGEGNRYGHPHKEVLEKLANISAKILNTAQVGTINLRGYGEGDILEE